MQLSSQAEILEYIIKNPGGSARQISRALQLTPADIHYHLAKLQQQGAIQPTRPVKPDQGAGRPTKGYVFAHRTPYDNTVNLFAAILRLHPELLHDDEISKLVRDLTQNFSPPQKPSVRLLAEQIVHYLTPMNYQPHWEASKGGPRLIFENCPYANLMPDYPQLCQLDLEIIQTLFGYPIIVLQTRWKTTGKPYKCIFQVNQ